MLTPEETDELLQVAYKQSYNQYKTPAFLYRRGEKLDDIQASERENMRSFLGPFSNSGEGERIMDEIQKLIIDALVSNTNQDYQDYEQTLFTLLSNKLESEQDHISKISCFPSMFDFLLMATTTYQNTVSQNHSKEAVESILTDQISKYKANRQVDNAYRKYFNKSLKDIEQDGTVYLLPKGDHKWKYNASWLLGHFNKSNGFIIYSDITNSAKYDRRGEFGSGFFREVAICYHLGYRCRLIDGNQIILRHPNPNTLINLKLKDIFDISETEELLRNIEHDYDQAVTEYTLLKDQLHEAQARGLNVYAKPYVPIPKNTSQPC